jgi:hypothetical protein
MEMEWEGNPGGSSHRYDRHTLLSFSTLQTPPVTWHERILDNSYFIDASR